MAIYATQLERPDRGAEQQTVALSLIGQLVDRLADRVAAAIADTLAATARTTSSGSIRVDLPSTLVSIATHCASSLPSERSRLSRKGPAASSISGAPISTRGAGPAGVPVTLGPSPARGS